MFGDFTFASIEGIIKDQVIQVMPSRDPSDNSVVLYLQMGKWDQTKFTIHQVYRTVVFVEEILLLRFFTLSYIRDPKTTSSVLATEWYRQVWSVDP